MTVICAQTPTNESLMPLIHCLRYEEKFRDPFFTNPLIRLKMDTEAFVLIHQKGPSAGNSFHKPRRFTSKS